MRIRFITVDPYQSFCRTGDGHTVLTFYHANHRLMTRSNRWGNGSGISDAGWVTSNDGWERSKGCSNRTDLGGLSYGGVHIAN